MSTGETVNFAQAYIMICIIFIVVGLQGCDLPKTRIIVNEKISLHWSEPFDPDEEFRFQTTVHGRMGPRVYPGVIPRDIF